MNRHVKKVTTYLMLIITVILCPFAIEKIVLSETIFPFNTAIAFSKESWFGFLGSYIGAIGTVSLGLIALYQNKKYRELSEESDKRYYILQENIEKLTRKNVELNEISTKFEEKKYFPNITSMNDTLFDVSDLLSFENDSFQMVLYNPNVDDVMLLQEKNFKYFFENYHTFVITLKNESGKEIRDFINTESRNILISNNKPYSGGWGVINESCDVKPGAFIRCVFATKFDLRNEIISGKIDSIHYQFRMKNVLSEVFEMRVDISFYPDQTDLDIQHTISPIYKINLESLSEEV